MKPAAISNQAAVKQLSKGRAVLYHLYPGIIIVLVFIVLTPILTKYHYPPQFSLLLSIILVAIPLLSGHLQWAKKKEHNKNFKLLNGFTSKLQTGKLVLYSLGLVVFSFITWSITQPLNRIIAEKRFDWLPHWLTIQEFEGYTLPFEHHWCITFLWTSFEIIRVNPD